MLSRVFRSRISCELTAARHVVSVYNCSFLAGNEIDLSPVGRSPGPSEVTREYFAVPDILGPVYSGSASLAGRLGPLFGRR